MDCKVCPTATTSLRFNISKVVLVLFIQIRKTDAFQCHRFFKVINQIVLNFVISMVSIRGDDENVHFHNYLTFGNDL